MANLIILEGLSRTGKTSITKELSNRHGFRHISIKNKKPEYVENLPDFYHGMHIIANEFFATFSEETFILDRSFMSELVYSKCFNRKTYINADHVIADLLHDNNFVLINLVTTHQEYLYRTPKESVAYSELEFNKQKDSFFFFYEHFRTHYPTKSWQQRFCEIDTNQYRLEDVVQRIESILEKNQILKLKNI